MAVAGPWYALNATRAVKFARFSSRYNEIAEGRPDRVPSSQRLVLMAADLAGLADDRDAHLRNALRRGLGSAPARRMASWRFDGTKPANSSAPVLADGVPGGWHGCGDPSLSPLL